MVGRTNADASGHLFQRVENLERVILVTFLTASWSASAPYTQTVSISGITAADQPVLVRHLDSAATEATAKAYNKAFGILSSGSGTTGAGTVTWKCYKKPATDITVGLKGV